jgi:hypothetical protein
MWRIVVGGCAILFLASLIYTIFLLEGEACKMNGKKTPSCALKEHLIFPHQSQKQGKQHAKNSRVVICGLIRDGQDKLSQNITLIEKIAKMFSDYRILVVENDSEDATRNVLLEWAKRNPKVSVLGCGVNEPVCKMRMPPTIGHEISNRRIEKMAILRNIYIDYIKNHLSDFDYLLIYDFDLVGYIYKDGIKDSFNILHNEPNVQGITANGVIGSRYYDPFAIFGQDSPSCFDNEVEKRLDEKRLLLDGVVPSTNDKEFRFRPNHGLIPVKSAFAGLAIYRIPRILNTNASYTAKCPGITCEHTAFAEALGGIYINPKMVLFIYRH